MKNSDGNRFSGIPDYQLDTLWFPFRVIARLVKSTGLPVPPVLELRREAYSHDQFEIQSQSWPAARILAPDEIVEWRRYHEALQEGEYLFVGGLSRSALFDSFSYALDSIPERTKEPLRGAHPTSIVAGFPKSATTWFYDTCKAFSFIDVGLKENCFFSSSNYCRGDVWYQNLFTSERPLRIDVSQDYLIAPGAIQRLADYRGRYDQSFKILVFVRKPSTWIHSAIFQHRTGAVIWDNLEEYLKTGYAAWNYEYAANWWPKIQKLAGWFDKEEILLIFQEDVESSPKEEFLRIVRFLLPDQDLEEVVDTPDTYFRRRVNARKNYRWPSMHRRLRDWDRRNRRLLAKMPTIRKLFTIILSWLDKRLLTTADTTSPHVNDYLSRPEIAKLDEGYMRFKKEYKASGDPFLVNSL